MKKALLFACSFVATSMIIAACGELTGPKSPETPINVTATLTGPTTAIITWAPSPQSDGVISYNVLRNGTKVGEATGTTYTDTGLGEKTTYTYTVSANCTSGVLSDPSPISAAATITTSDITGPRIVLISPFANQTQVSPSATVEVTFNEAMDPNTITTTTFSLKNAATGANIPGTVAYVAASLVARFTPSSALPSGATITATVTAGMKDIAGNVLQITPGSPGVWNFTIRDDVPPTVTAVSPLAGATGVSASTAVTITFSEPMDATTITAANITLRVTSSGANVPGIVGYNATTRVATFTPTAALSSSPVSYTVTVGTGVKDAAGNPLAAAFQSIFTTADVTAPTVLSTTPASGATNVPVNTTVTAQFSKAMDPNTITPATFQLKTTVGGTTVPGTVAYNTANNTATFTPTAPLSSQTAYTATITTGAKDTFGNSLAAGSATNPWTFSTADVTPPTVALTLPATSTNVPVNTTIQLTFSEAMNQSTINGTNITVKTTNTLVPVAGIVTYNATTNVATFTPTGALLNATSYTVTVSTAVTDAVGNQLAAPFTATFTTAAAPDTTAPTVVATNPVDGANNASITTSVQAQFSEAMDPLTITATTFTVRTTVGSTPVAGTVSYNSTTNIATFTANAPLANNTGYTATITGGAAGAKDVAGNQLAANKVWTFTTNTPTATATSPTNGQTGVAVNTTVTVTFSEAMDQNTINGTTFSLRVTATSAGIAGTVTYNTVTHVATFTPTASLTANTNYTATVTTGATDAGGNPLVAPVNIIFTTAP